MRPRAGFGIGPRLDMRQAQSLVMTPQLQQAIKLLQLSNQEVVAYVESEIEQNPLLERAEAEDSGEAGSAAAPETAAPTPSEGLLDRLPAGEDAQAAGDAPLDTDFQNEWTEEPGDAGGGLGARPIGSGRGDFDGSVPDLAETLSREVTLREHLVAQINVDLIEPVERIVALHLLEQLDDAGYFTGDPAAVAAALRCETALVERVLAKLQDFDPPGIFARTLRECLEIQLRDRGRLDAAMAALLERLDLIARRDFPALAQACGVSAPRLAAMIAELKTLDPKPGLAFDRTAAQPVVADVLMRPTPDGGWHVELNSETLPRVLLNHRFHARISQQARSKSERDFIAERFHAANWLVKSLHQRAQTILKVASEIVRQQDAFFRHGVAHLRPLVLRDIAAAIGMHESTVSRVTTNKFLASPHGIYELKYFFTAAIASAAGGESHSAEAVRFRIKSLIDGEPADGVLSDDRIVELLRDDGIDIARRTVAKYRDALRIPSSLQRRRDKSLNF